MILCAGEALIDMIPTPVASGPDAFTPHAGGAVFNTAIALGRLGVATALYTGMSRDLFGEQLIHALAASGVTTDLVTRSDRPTTLAFVQLTDGHASYSFYDENTAGRMLLEADLPTLPDEISTLYFGGISLACEPCADTYAALLAREHGNHLVVIDPNIRPRFIANTDRYRARLDRMLTQSDIVKVSDEDLDWIDPAPLSMAQKAAKLLSKGPSVVIVTRGGAGATGFLADGTDVTVPAPKVEIRDTVGAGDTFNAGVLAKLSELGLLHKASRHMIDADALSQALTHGAKVAAVTVSRAGANPPWADEL